MAQRPLDLGPGEELDGRDGRRPPGDRAHRGGEMNTYVIRRREAWSTPAELQAAAERSTAVAEEEFPGRISWIRSYVVEEADGGLGTICIYQAADVESVRDHAGRVGMPADEVLSVADTVIVRPDPEAAAA
jgi:hypothetical protein